MKKTYITPIVKVIHLDEEDEMMVGSLIIDDENTEGTVDNIDDVLTKKQSIWDIMDE